MTSQELAARLDGRTYGSEITDAEAREAQAAGLVAVFGGSDDLVYFAGAAADERGAGDGTLIYFTSAGLLYNQCKHDECPHDAKRRETAATIEAKWSEDGYSWTYETAIPHATFDIMDEGEKYCRGIVFALADVKGGAQ